jgi:hypothetical protein
VLTGFSLAFLGIEDGADIYTLPEDLHPMPEQTHSEKVCDRECFFKVLGELHGPNCEDEFCGRCFSDCDRTLCHQVARIKDRFFEKVEGTVRSHRKMLRNFFRCKTKKDADSSDSSDRENPEKK